MRHRVWVLVLPLLFCITVLIAFDTYQFMVNIRPDLRPTTSALPEQVLKNLRQKYHLNEPIMKIYWRFMASRAKWDLGPSFRYKDHTVMDFVRPAIPEGIIVPLSITLLVLAGTLLLWNRRTEKLLFYYIACSIILSCWGAFTFIFRRNFVEVTILICALTISLGLYRLPKVIDFLIYMGVITISIYYSFTVSWLFGLEKWAKIANLSALNRDYTVIWGLSFLRIRFAMAATILLGYARLFAGNERFVRKVA